MGKMLDILTFRKHAVYETMMPVSDEVLKNLPVVLKDFRKKYNVTPADMADMMGISNTLYYYIETGSRPITLKHYRMAMGVIGYVDTKFKDISHCVIASRKRFIYDKLMPIPEKMLPELPEKLLSFRKKYNISAHEMANMMGISYCTYHHLEASSRPVELHHYRIAAGVMASVNAAVKKYCLS